MQSKNFSFLQEHDPKLDMLGGVAEFMYPHDANTALIKLRQFAELLASHVAAKSGLMKEAHGTQVELLTAFERRGIMRKDTLAAFHFMRKKGNHATHQFTGSHKDALTALKLAHAVGVWFHRSWGDRTFAPATFVPPAEVSLSKDTANDEIEELKKLLAESRGDQEKAAKEVQRADEARLSAQQRASKAEAERREWESLAAEAEEDKLSLLKRLEETAPEIPQPQADVALELDEKETRQLIDIQLREMGWQADSETLVFSKGIRPPNKGSIAISEWPAGTGRVDYALFVDGTCLGVIEAKRAASDVPGVLEQAKRYARELTLDGDQKGTAFEHGGEKYRVPFCLATNGRGFVKQYAEKSGIWFWDARSATNQSTSLSEWFSPQDLLSKLSQESANATDALKSEPFDYAGLRPYQQEAVSAVETSLAADKRNILVAMATGTGKTRTCIALMYRLIKHKKFRRILFLVDRRSLAEQTIEALENTELEGLLKFTQSYNVAGLEKKNPEAEDRVQIATVQSLVKRIMHGGDNDNKLSPGTYDCIIVDEAHRGYTLDAELREDDIVFRNTDDYLSTYRKVLDYFDATKIALTATPALHTAEIFGAPVYRYSYRQAVIDGYLIDHLPPKRIVTALNQAGIHFDGGETVEVIDMKSGEVDTAQLPDEVDFEVDQFNKKVHTRAFNTVVCEAIAAEIPPDTPGKVLLFASRDDHADLLVEELRKALRFEYGEIAHDLVQKITGRTDKPIKKIREFRNNERPKYVVTVDLLSTGVDIPQITDLVFVRRVNSRILYDQMIGRATRKADEIGKKVFRIFDAVDLYANLQNMSEMRPVVTNPSISFSQLATDLANAPEAEDKKFVQEQMVVKARLKAKRMSDEAAERFETLTGQTPSDFVEWLKIASPTEIVEKLTKQPRIIAQLDQKEKQTGPWDKTIISPHDDELLAIEEVFGDNLTPEDYIESFERFIRDNMNQLPALIAATQRPRELTRKALREIASALEEKGFAERQLRAAYGKTGNAEIAAHIIGYIRRAAIGDPLVPYEARVDRALTKIETSREWTKTQKQWLRRLGRALKEQPIGDPTLLDQGQFAQHGGFSRINELFDNQLETVLQDLNDAIWSTG